MNEKRCPSCGAAIDLNASECRYCGESFSGAQQQQVPPVNNYSSNSYSEKVNSGNNYSDNFYSYLKPYYQEQFRKISDSNEIYKGKWNWCAFFFTWIWALTKGLWAVALVSIGITVLISSIDSDLAFLGFGISIFFGMRGNYLYYNLVKYKKQFPQK